MRLNLSTEAILMRTIPNSMILAATYAAPIAVLCEVCLFVATQYATAKHTTLV